MKYIAILCVLALTGCATGPGEDQGPTLYVDPVVLQDENARTGWMAFGMALVAWKPETGANGELDLLKREIYAREMTAKIWKDLKAKGKNHPDPHLDVIEMVSDAGYTAEYVWVYVNRDDWPQTVVMDLTGFNRWSKAHLIDHVPVLDPGVRIQ